jgi:hypothetical protein
VRNKCKTKKKKKKKKHTEKTKKHTLTRPENFLGASNVKKTQKIVHPKSNLKMK